MSRRPVAALALAAALAACAGPGLRDLSDAELSSAGPRAVALSGFQALLRGDGPAAGRRFAEALRRDPADPWARLGAATAARRGLDDAEELRQLAALVQAAPDHPLAGVAARRMGELAERAPALAEAVEAALAPPLEAGRLSGLAASRARAARVQAAEVLGERARAARLRAESGAVADWTLSGPWSAHHLLELSRPFPPEQGPLPAEAPGPGGQPAAPARPLRTGDGLASLEGEPAGQGDVYYLAAALTAARGGDYLVAVGGTGALLAWLDGEPLAARRTAEGLPPTAQVVARRLAAGEHRLLVKLVRGPGVAARLAVSVARADGAPSDVRAAPAAPGAPAGPAAAGPPPPALNLPACLAEALAGEAGPVLARWVAARDGGEIDREAGKALLDEALAAEPASPLLLAARAQLAAEDATLDERAARGRAEGLLDRALASDPANSAARLQRAEWARAAERTDDAAALLAALPAADAGRPRAALARAGVALARGFAEGAEREADQAWRDGGLCAAAELLQELAQRVDAVARADELVRARARCPGGRELLAERLRRRGDLAGAAALLREAVQAAPARLDRRLELARTLVAAGDLPAAGEALEEGMRTWPRDPGLARRRAEVADLAGDGAAARTWRERSLALDGGDLALHRALAAEDGRELLDDLDVDGRAALKAFRQAGSEERSSGTYVLDHAAVQVLSGGAYLERTHQVVALHDQRAVDRFGELQVPPGADLLTARTLKADGRVLEAEERGEKGTISLPGLEPGDAAEWDWVRALRGRGPALPGFSADVFFFRGDLPMARTSYFVAAPPGAGLRFEARRLDPPPALVREGGRDLVKVVRERVPALQAEPGAPPDTEFMPLLQAGAGTGPEALPVALGDALAEAGRPSLELSRLARSVEASVPEAGRGGEPLLRALFARTGDLVAGPGGGLGDQASQVLSRGRGSRLVLLHGLLQALGWRSHLALAREFGHDPSPLPFPRSDTFTVPLLLVERGEKSWWLDASARQVPFGAVSAAARGQPAAVLPAPGEAPRLLTVPAGEESERREVELRVQIAEGGAAVIEGLERYRGWDAAAYKSSLERIDPEQRRQAMEQLLARGFRGGRLEAVAFEGEGDPEAPLTVRWKLAVPGWARAEGGRLVLEAPVLPPRLMARFGQRAARELPLLVAVPERAALRVTVTPPPGWRPAPRPAAEVRGAPGSYRRAERAEGPALVREDALELRRGRVAPAEYPAFTSFASEVDEAQGAPMVFQGATPGVAANP